MTPRRAVVAIVGLVGLGLLGASCGSVEEGWAPHCDAEARLAIIAQSVPGAAYVPCVGELPAGWSFEELDVDDGGATLELASDRADRPVEVSLVDECDTAAAVPIAPRDEGVRTYHQVDSIEPRYAGRLLDVFPGGCVVSAYDFERGPHIALIGELQEAVGLRSRLELRQRLADEVGVTLDR